MSGIFRRIRKLLLDITGFSMLEDETSEASQVIDTLELRLAEMRTAVAHVLANQHRIERMLRSEKTAGHDAAIEPRVAQLETVALKELPLRRQGLRLKWQKNR